MNRASYWLVRQWRDPTLGGQFLLQPLSWAFRLLVASRRLAYRCGLLRTRKLTVPVIVVGNLTVGGSGKTPLVLHLVAALQAAGWKAGVVSRGHGSHDRGPRRFEGRADALAAGDEPALIADRGLCPVAVGRDRPAAAALLESDCDIIVSDDGLQHLALGRDVEIAVVDGDLRSHNGRMLPAGPLREPLGRLRSVDFVATRGGDRGRWHFDIRAGVPRRLHDERAGDPADWSGRAVHAVAGIGVPERFFGQLEEAGIEVERHAFPDHHPFRPDDLAFDDDRPILMTEKDAVKCRAFATDRMFVVPAEVIDHDDLAGAVVARLAHGER